MLALACKSTHDLGLGLCIFLIKRGYTRLLWSQPDPIICCHWTVNVMPYKIETINPHSNLFEYINVTWHLASRHNLPIKYNSFWIYPLLQNTHYGHCLSLIDVCFFIIFPIFHSLALIWWYFCNRHFMLQPVSNTQPVIQRGSTEHFLSEIVAEMIEKVPGQWSIGQWSISSPVNNNSSCVPTLMLDLRNYKDDFVFQHCTEVMLMIWNSCVL